MADNRVSPNLEKKRKREGAEPLRKKAKTRARRKSEVEDAVPIEVADTPVAKSQTKGKAVGETSKATLTNGINGALEETATPQSSSKKRSKKQHTQPAKEDVAEKATLETPSSVANVSKKIPDDISNVDAAEQTPSRKKKKSNRRKTKDPKQSADVNTEHNAETKLKATAAQQQTKNSGKQSEALVKHELDAATPSKVQRSQKTKGKQQKSGKPEAEADATTSGLTSQRSSKAKGKKGRSKASSSWSVSAPLGGWFLSQDPVFTRDEKFLVLANTRSLQIYSTESSLLSSALPFGSGYISAYALSSTNPNHIYTANSEGLIILWDWTEGKKIGRWDIGSSVRHITVTRQPGSEQDLVYSHEVGSSHVIRVHALRTKDQGSQTEVKQIFKTKSTIIEVQVLLDGNIVIIATQNSISVGKRSKLHKTALQDFEYIWREFQTSQRITTFSAYVHATEQSGTTAQQAQQDHLDVAIGHQDGVINLYEDILNAFATIENSQKQGAKATAGLETLRPKCLHWHREAVGSVKWSLDGNYIISGGAETVLVLWQLSTGKQQHLPHLTAAIENIVVSPTGASYSVTLANNSVVLLSTSELEAKANIVGIQSRRVDLERLPRESKSSEYSFDIFTQVPMAVHPKKPSQVLFSIPSSQPRHRVTGVLPEPYVQTFDLAAQRSIGRQALTRNNATDTNTGPDGSKILEPNVTFLQISHNGQWLATVDEWAPSRADLGYLDEGMPNFKEEERMLRREVYLKFWRWDEKTMQWGLETRIDAPHFLETVGGRAKVLDLIPDPVSLGFATIGEDRYVRVWRPKTRTINGTIVRGADKNKGEGLVTWSLDRSVELSNSVEALEQASSSQALLPSQTARLAFSPDGSVLAASISFASESDVGAIHIIDATIGTIRRSITELDVAALSCLGIIGRHMVVVGDSVTVWDLVADEVVYSVPFDTPGVDLFERRPLVRLAINEPEGTFAISMPRFETKESSKSRNTRHFKKPLSTVSVFDPHQPKALWSSTVPDILLSLKSTNDGQGFITLDSNSAIRLINPKARALQLITPPPESEQQLVAKRVEEVESDVEQEAPGTIKDTEMLSDEEYLLRNLENDKPVVRPEQLQQIFDVGPSHALPPVKDLLNAVVDLYTRKPRVIGTA